MTNSDVTFQPWGGEHDKVLYDVLLPDGEIVQCWPNEGRLHYQGDDDRFRGKYWTAADGVKIRVSREAVC